MCPQLDRDNRSNHTLVLYERIKATLGISLHEYEDEYEDEYEEEADACNKKRLRSFRRNAKTGVTVTALVLVCICIKYWAKKNKHLLRSKSSLAKAFSAILASSSFRPLPVGSTGRVGSNASGTKSEGFKSKRKINGMSIIRKKNANIDNYRSAEEAPLSVLLSAAKSGTVSRVLMNKSSIVYRLANNVPTKGSNNNSVNGSNNGSKSMSKSWKRSSLPQNNADLATKIVNTLMNNGCLDISSLPEPLLTRLAPILLNLSPFLYLILLYRMMKKLQTGNDDVKPTTSDDLNQEETTLRTTFSDIAGIDNQIELEEIVSYLSDPRPFLGVGATPPRGLLLHGPPGCGKTLLARAVAGESQADYFVSCSGSDFVEIYVGQGSKRVRDLFARARMEALRRWRWKRKREVAHIGGLGFGRVVERAKNMVGLGWHYGSRGSSSTSSTSTPTSHLRPPTAVIFIDEIDAVSKCRDGSGRGLSFGGGGLGSNDEREQTLNALLTEMDGFNNKQQSSMFASSSLSPSTISEQQVLVIVIAATNRISIIDPAILRPGRFDRHVMVPPPDREGRAAILAIHARNVNLNDHLCLDDFAKDNMTKGFTGADLKNVVNEAALLAVRSGSLTVRENHMKEAVRRIQGMKFI